MSCLGFKDIVLGWVVVVQVLGVFQEVSVVVVVLEAVVMVVVLGAVVMMVVLELSWHQERKKELLRLQIVYIQPNIYLHAV